MSWQETSNGRGPSRPSQPGGPPDLDELLRRILNWFNGPESTSGTPGKDSEQRSVPWVWILLLVGGVAVFYDMFHLVDEQERAVVLRFGKHVATLQPGLNVRLPRPIERIYKRNVQLVHTFAHEDSMLTQDENIVKVQVAVQYRIGDLERYLFNVTDPEATLRQATESAVRAVIGKSKLDLVLTEGRSAIADGQQVLIQDTLEEYKSGFLVVGVEMQSAQPPEQVKASFDDVTTAREDRQRLINEAEAYRNDVLPKARGEAARIQEEANAYKARVVARAEGEAGRFELLLMEYRLAPAITRQRIYLDTMEALLSSTSKVLLDAPGGNQLIYLPVDRLLGGDGVSGSAVGKSQATPAAPPRNTPPITARPRGRVSR